MARFMRSVRDRGLDDECESERERERKARDTQPQPWRGKNLIISTIIDQCFIILANRLDISSPRHCMDRVRTGCRYCRSSCLIFRTDNVPTHWL